MKKSDNSNNKNNKKDSTSDFSSKQKRSSKFDELTGTHERPNSTNSNSFTSLPPKEQFKKVWKWISICIYLFLAGLGVTGFIQSCVLRTTSTVGAGVELYNDKNGVAPYVTSFKIVEKTRSVVKTDENGNPVVDENGNLVYENIKYYDIENMEKENFLTDSESIAELKNQLKETYSNKYGDEHGKAISDLYGVYNNYSSALRVIGIDNEEMTSSDSNLAGDVEAKGLLKGNETNGFLFMNDRILNYLNENGIQYISQNKTPDINLFVVKRPVDNWDSLTNSQKDYYGTGVTDISNAFQAYETINGKEYKVETQNGQYVTKDVNGDGVIDSSSYVVIKDQERISKFKYSLNAEVATLGKDDELLNSEAFARDYLFSILNFVIRFPQFQDMFEISGGTGKIDQASSSSVYSTFSKSKFEELTNENKRFTLKQKNAIITYQNEINALMTKMGFGVRQQVYSDESSDYYVGNNQTPFKIEFMPTTKNKNNVVVGIGAAAQKPITSWGEAWKLGPFYGLIVWPLSYTINGMMGGMPSMNGWAGIIAIVIAILLTRVIVTLFTYKSLFATHKQQQLNPKKAKIDAKYEPFKGNREMEQRKRQEIAKLYKSHNVSMMAPLKAMCISMPIFFAVWRVVQGIPDIKATTWLGIQFSLTSWRELFSGEWQYLPLLILAAATQAISQLLPKFLNKKRMDERANRAEKAALKKSNKTQNIVMIVFIVMSVLFEAGVQIYWIVGGLWQIAQVLIVHHIVKSEWYRTKGYKYV